MALPIFFIYITEGLMIDYVGCLLFFTTVLWAIVYDTQYAMIDKEFDKKINLYSSSILFDRNEEKVILSLQMIHILLYMYIYILLNMYFFFFVSLCVALIFIAYQNYLVKTNKCKNFFKAFLNNNYYGFTLNIVIIIYYLL